MRLAVVVYLTCLLLLWNANLQPVRAEDRVDFSRDVRPLLAEHCFHCHGPDKSSRAAGLRLDDPAGIFRTKNGVTIVEPNKSDQSELIRRIFSTDPDEQMPPPDSNRQLSEDEKLKIQAWVEQGAIWGKHWSFEPRKPALPPGFNPSRQHDGSAVIDGWIQFKLKEKGITSLGPAPPEDWLRRAYLDLNGLPPTYDEQTEFLHKYAKNAAAAKDEIVKMLFKSPRYGERMAADWLDLARYADSHGYQADRIINVWPYRDWVIRAFNQNMPYDQFLIEQLAGDLLPNPTQDQQLATAFNRLHMQNEEGGIIEEEFRVAYVVDRVNTFGTTVLGMTMDCCRCHDHKYDPFTQKDYYGLFAFFQNIDESGQTSHFTKATPTPALTLITPEQQHALDQLTKDIGDQEIKLKQITKESEARFETWSKQQEHLAIIPRLPIAQFPFDDEGPELTNKIDPQKPGKKIDNPKSLSGKLGKALAFDGDNGAEFPGIPSFSKDDTFSISFWLQVEQHLPRMVILHQSKAPIDAGYRGFDLVLENGHIAFGLYHFWPGNAMKVLSTDKITTSQWQQITVTYDGSSRAAGMKIYLNGELLKTKTIRDKLTRDILYGHSEPFLTVGQRFRDSGLKNGKLDELKIYNCELTNLEIAKEFNQQSTYTDFELQSYYIQVLDSEYNKAFNDLQAKKIEYTNFYNSLPEIMVMQEQPEPKPAFLLERGDYNARGERIQAKTPAILPPFPIDQPLNRLGLARWATHPDHPLTARVVVNRLWQQCFGVGLISSSDNFGSTGENPTHPELLDWLAQELINQNWNIQSILKTIIKSDTYSKSSSYNQNIHTMDPENRYYSRYKPRRLTAEMLRDQMLYQSHLLFEKIGGPPIYPIQPEDTWADTIGKPTYKISQGNDRFRRSVYAIRKRTAANPQEVIFDGSDRNQCISKRETTSTPLQALYLINNEEQNIAIKAIVNQVKVNHDNIAEVTQQIARKILRRNLDKEIMTILQKDLYKINKSNKMTAQELLEHIAMIMVNLEENTHFK